MSVFGKILLFGEYAILEGGNALSVPSRSYFGQLRTEARGQDSLHSHRHLLSFAHYLEENFEEHFNLVELKSDLNQKLYFEANIPQGYGLGSSAALVAAFLKRYGRKLPETLQEKKDLFGAIESHFHGKSSGLDVLVCYENAPILLRNSKLSIGHSVHEEDYKKFRLLDTEQTGLTSQLVSQFKAQNTSFKDRFREVFVAGTNRAIDYFLTGKEKEMFLEMKMVSAFTYEHMPWTIPDDHKALWKEQLEEESSVMKLCGSGGGGFILRYDL